jgi:hypothetical protein
VCSAAELAAALTVVATIWPSWRILYPNSGIFEGRGAVVGRGVPQAGLRGLLMTIRMGYSGRRGGVPFPHASRRRSGCNSARRGAASTGAAAQDQQLRGWRPAGLASRPGPASSRESSSRVWPAPLRGRGALAIREQAAWCHGADTGHVAQSPTVAGMGFP